jgi:phosphatidylserine decarboxylase
LSASVLIGAVAACILMQPLILKWQLGLRRVFGGLAALVLTAWALGSLCNLSLHAAAGTQVTLGAVITMAGALAIVAQRFYRDPDRTTPAGDQLIVSPADGEVVYVKHSEDGSIPVSTKRGRRVALQELTYTPVHADDATVIGIGMSFLDVHVNRAPIAGRVILHRHFAGAFGSLRNPEMVFANERATTVIANADLQLAVVQIASRLVRQIITLVKEGQELKAGQRIGSIRFGSQVDIVLPKREGLRVLVKAGDRVEAGMTVIGTFAKDQRVQSGHTLKLSRSRPVDDGH